jgi:hypothetical protein
MMDEEEVMSEPQPSYAYLLDKDKERLCRKDLNYCTWDENGNPIPFCFEYPNDKRCHYNTNPPNLLFMGCYDDATCGGKPIGKIKISSDKPPYAYTVDGKCVQSGKLCDWITDEIAVPRCAKENNVQKCRDIADNVLIGCYTEETCGGNVLPQKTMDTTTDMGFTQQRSSYVEKETPPQRATTKKKKKNKIRLSLPLLVLIIFIPIVLTLLSLFSFSVYWEKKKKYKPSKSSSLRQIQTQTRPPKSKKSV